MTVDSELDVVIAGGGMVGASLATLLGRDGFSVCVVDPFPFSSQDQPSFDERTVALTYSSRLIFEALGIWRDIARRGANPIRSITVTNLGHFGMTRLDSVDAGTEALGYVVPNRHIGAALYESMGRQAGITLKTPARVTQYVENSDCVDVSIAQDEIHQSLRCRLLVIADGGRSGLAADRTKDSSYSRQALVTMVKTDCDHRDMAFERFTESGPLALLPAADKTFAVVWTLKDKRLQIMKSCGDAEFLASLQQTFGWRAGQFTEVGKRASYPLRLASVKQAAAGRTVVIGNAAHTVHPVAGQGFNLGLRDVALLGRELAGGRAQGHDPGSRRVRQRYLESRKIDVDRVSRFTDGLIRLFGSGFLPIALARNTGLSVLNLIPGLRRRILRRTMGMHRIEGLLPDSTTEERAPDPGPPDP